MSVCDAIAIDLGTSFCRAAVFRDGKLEIVKNKNNKLTTPSVVAFRNDGYSFGEEAIVNEEIDSINLNVVSNIKRLIGRWINDEKVLQDKEYCPFQFTAVGSNLKIKIDCQNRSYYPEEIAGILLSEMKENAEKHLSRPVTKAMITVPASFNNLQRQATVNAGKLAGFETVQLINKPTAIAIDYYYEKGMKGTKVFCVFHLGGGSFDVSIIKVDGRSYFEVDSTVGNSHLGGVDFDQRLIDCFIDKCEVENHENARKYLLESLELRKACENAKIVLSSQEYVTITAEEYTQTISREEFELKCSDLFDEMRYHVETLFKKSKIKKKEIDDVLIAGGSAPIPKVFELFGLFEKNSGSYYIDKLITAFWRKSKLHHVRSQIAARGAAIHAATTSKRRIVEVLPNVIEYKGSVENDTVVCHTMVLHRSSKNVKLVEREALVPHKGVVFEIYETGTLIERIEIAARPSCTQELYVTIRFKYDENNILTIESLVHTKSGKEVVASILKRCHMTEEKSVELCKLDMERECGHEKTETKNLQPKVAIGIDIGTTSSRVAVFHKRLINVLDNEHGKRTTPSTVKFTEHETLVGEKGGLNVMNSIFNTKRLIGKKFSDSVVQSDIKFCSYNVIEEKSRPVVEVEFKDRMLTMVEISALLLRKMKTIAANFVGNEIKEAVITVPAFFDDGQRQATINAATIAGLDTIQLINSSTAAAVAYYIENPTIGKRNMFVLSFGGGSIEASILTVDGFDIKVKRTAGDKHFGGVDFDNRLIRHFMKEFQKIYSTKDPSKNKRALFKLREACVEVKRKLSFLSEAEVEITSLFDDEDFQSMITRDKFEELCNDLFNVVVRVVERPFSTRKIKKSDIHDILLIGGSTRLPKVQAIVRDFFGGEEKIRHSVNFDEVCVFGAAVVAAQNSGVDDKKIENLKILDHPWKPRSETINGRLSEKEIETIMAEIEKMDLKTEKYKKLSEAKNELEEYTLSMMRKLKSLESLYDVENGLMACEQTLEWINEQSDDNLEIEKVVQRFSDLKIVCELTIIELV